MDTLARNLEFLMEHKGLGTQPKLARATGVSQTHIGNILRREKLPGLGVLQRLATGLGVEVWQLLGPTEMLERGMDRDIARLMSAYLRSNEKGRQTIYAVAEAQAAYRVDDPGL